VLTHGFMVDADREKISKSKQGSGGYVKPQTAERYVNEHGADVLRLWVASQDFRNDIIVSEERLQKVGETYRLIRNSLRYQLSNLFDFDPARHAVPDSEMTGLDRWILGEFAALEKACEEAYNGYAFHVAYQRLAQFAAVQLSALYHDVAKGRLYTDAPDSPRRRSTQTALHRLVTGLCQILAPILAFTADEAWELVPGQKVPGVHLSDWVVREFPRASEEKLLWERLLAIRESVLPELEKARKAGRIGKALEAKVVLSVPAEESALEAARESLEELLSVSQLVIQQGKGTELTIEILPAEGTKCERCWRWGPDVGRSAEHPTLCGRCVRVVEALGAAV
jgi:isoleucyl-tRNA synthetase